MKVSDALTARKSVRAFLDQPVARAVIERILDKARWAPSGTNTQPWEVVVTMGEAKREICRAMEEAYLAGQPAKMDYAYYPSSWTEPFQGRRVSCGRALYKAIGIEKGDAKGRRTQWARNYRAFDAPVALFFFLDRHLETGSFLDYGLFIQSIMLMAAEEGLATCSQASLADYPDLARSRLKVDQHKLLICGMALGYEDSQAPINNYRTTREEVAKFTRFVG